MYAEASNDKLILSSGKGADIYYPMNKLPLFEFSNYVVKNGKKRKGYKSLKKKHKSVSKYLTVIKYKEPNTGNILIICNRKKGKSWAASPLYLIFYPSFPHPVLYSHVKAIERFFLDECGIKLRVSAVHIAVDIIDEGNRDLFRQVVRSIKPGTKRKPCKLCKRYKGTRYFGHFRSSNQLIVYDKSRQLRRKKGIVVPVGRVRVECRLKPPQLFDLPSTVNELANFDWSMLMPRYFSFHIPTSKFMLKMNMAGESWRRPIWRLRDLAWELFGITPSNFYRDCLMEHTQFTKHVAEALANFRWA
ncbi:hypothetical protein [uncultured Desulfosarcina sp.]|uniref:hypothetical protein n=1 Tax=uncultured Desulfosarcina sp. TaxID=218289 RepID=UPI0029C8F571|nr:hypothetical protein [uncultured Desulfosarcina sp.]